MSVDTITRGIEVFVHAAKPIAAKTMVISFLIIVLLLSSLPFVYRLREPLSLLGGTVTDFLPFRREMLRVLRGPPSIITIFFIVLLYSFLSVLDDYTFVIVRCLLTGNSIRTTVIQTGIHFVKSSR